MYKNDDNKQVIVTMVTMLTCSRRIDFSLITVICDFSSAFSSKQTKEQQLVEVFSKKKHDFFKLITCYVYFGFKGSLLP